MPAYKPLEKQERQAIMVADPEQKRTTWTYPPVFTEDGHHIFLPQEYTTTDYKRNFPPGALVVVEPTDEYATFSRSPETGDFWRLWRLVEDE